MREHSQWFGSPPNKPDPPDRYGRKSTLASKYTWLESLGNLYINVSVNLPKRSFLGTLTESWQRKPLKTNGNFEDVLNFCKGPIFGFAGFLEVSPSQVPNKNQHRQFSSGGATGYQAQYPTSEQRQHPIPSMLKWWEAKNAGHGLGPVKGLKHGESWEFKDTYYNMCLETTVYTFCLGNIGGFKGKVDGN